MEVIKVGFRETCQRGIYTGLTWRFQKIINFMPSRSFLVLFANFNGEVIKFQHGSDFGENHIFDTYGTHYR